MMTTIRINCDTHITAPDGAAVHAYGRAGVMPDGLAVFLPDGSSGICPV
jgi:hypothetical protein